MKINRKAILIVHGFAGGTYDYEYLAHRLELIENFDVFTFTLPGHDGNFDKKITAKSWIEKAEKEIEFLLNNGYKNIYVIGHSMGGVIASHLASKYNEIKKLVLVAPAFRHVGCDNDSLDVNIENALHGASDILEQYGSRLVANRMLKLPTNCFIEFRKIVKDNQDTPSKINIPTLIIRGTNDKVVPQESVDYVFKNLKTKFKRIVTLKNITHDVFRENMKKQAVDLIIKFFKNTSSMKYFPASIFKKDDDNKN